MGRRGVPAPRRPTRRLREAGLICRLLVSGYDSETPDEIQDEALLRACRASGLGEQFKAAVEDDRTRAPLPRVWLDELPFER